MMTPLITTNQGNAKHFAVALSQLKENGYTLECRRESTCIYCFEWHQYILPHSFRVDASYYFERTGNPDEDRILYAITLSQGAKAYLVDTCHVYADNISNEMLRTLKGIR